MNPLTLADLPDKLKQQSKRQSLAKGQILVQQYERADWFFGIEAGWIQLMSFVGDQMITHYFVEDNQFFCEGSLYSDRYQCTAIAEVPTTVIAIPKYAFVDALKKYPMLCEQYLASLTYRFCSVRTLLEIRSIRPARERVLRYLMTQRFTNQTTVMINNIALLMLSICLGLAINLRLDLLIAAEELAID